MLDLSAIFNPEPTPSRVEDLDPDWRVEWEERAAIIECDGSLPREHAEALALADIIARIRRGERFGACCPCPACVNGTDTCSKPKYCVD
jgi:hypothetical protein